MNFRHPHQSDEDMRPTNDRRKKSIIDLLIPALLAVLIAVGSVVGTAVVGAIKDLTDQVRVLSGEMAAVKAIQNSEKEQRMQMANAIDDLRQEQNAIRDIMETKKAMRKSAGGDK